MLDEIETQRLRLRQWRAADFETYAAFYADPELARFVGGHSSREPAWRRLAALIGHWSLRGYGYWAVEEKETGEFVGCVGLWRSEGWPELELGYWLVPAMHGLGYATEAGAQVRDYAWKVLGAESLVSYIDPENEPSARVAERLGAQPEDVIELLDYGPHRVYRYPQPTGLAVSGTGVDRKPWSGRPPGATRFVGISPVLACRDLLAETKYYCDRLGFNVDWTWGEPPVRAGVAMDGLELQLVSDDRFAPSGTSRVYYLVEGVDAYYEACALRGAEIEVPLGDRPFGMRDFRVTDRSGNLLGFGEPTVRDTDG